MIRFLDESARADAVRRFGADPFGVRALAGALAYGDRTLAGVWMQDHTTLIGRTADALTLCGAPPDVFRTAELLDFFAVTGGRTLLLPAGLLPAPPLRGWSLRRTGVVMRAAGEGRPQAPEAAVSRTVSARALTALLCAAQSPWIETGDPDALYVDLSHRLRHDCIRAFVCEADGHPAACALTDGETPRAALIGGVAAMPDQRGHGYASAALHALCAALRAEKKQIFLFTGAELTGFYWKNGFAVEREWVEFER